MYNFTVGIARTYFVGDGEWLVHNSGPCNIPTKASDVLAHIRNTGNAPRGYKGGAKFENDGRKGGQILPRQNGTGNPITYKEYDVNLYQRGVNRGAERIVIGSDRKAYYTSDHYFTFTPME